MSAEQHIADYEAPLDWHNASDHPTVHDLLTCPLHHREFTTSPASTQGAES